MLQEENNCRCFSCLITQGLLTRITLISVTKLWGSMFTRFLIKEDRKKTSKTDGLINRYGGRDLSKSRIIAGKSIWHWQLIACIVNLILSTYLLSIYNILSIEEEEKNEGLTFSWSDYMGLFSLQSTLWEQTVKILLCNMCARPLITSLSHS